MKDIEESLAILLARTGLRQPGIQCVELGTGGNNRIYRVRCSDRDYALKHYFSHPGDRRDRLGAETAFLGFLNSQGVTGVPSLIAQDKANNVALLEWVDGQRPRVIDGAHVRQVGQLFARINQKRSLATDIGPASDSSFSIAEALEMVERRLNTLMTVSRGASVERDAARLADEMNRLWPEIKRATEQAAAVEGIDLDAEVPSHERCLSPSDFGMHNALETLDGKLVFVDFEYAGWDDPAKMTADFFCQPAVPVSLRFWDAFMEEAFAGFSNAYQIAARAQILLPATQLRWSAIALNPFLPVSMARRQFSRADLEDERHKRRQLKLAQSLFEQVAA